MSKKAIEQSVNQLVEEIIKDTEFELIDIEYVKEGPFKYLRVYLDKEGGISIDDCANISRALNKKLDDIDLIKEQYFLEVSSPGVERPYKTEKDFLKNIGKVVEAKFYKPVNNKKSVTGILKEKKENSVVLTVQEEEIEIYLKDISKINTLLEEF